MPKYQASSLISQNFRALATFSSLFSLGCFSLQPFLKPPDGHGNSFDLQRSLCNICNSITITVDTHKAMINPRSLPEARSSGPLSGMGLPDASFHKLGWLPFSLPLPKRAPSHVLRSRAHRSSMNLSRHLFSNIYLKPASFLGLLLPWPLAVLTMDSRVYLGDHTVA